MREQEINDKLQGSVATYLRFSWVDDNQIKKGLLLSLSVTISLIGAYLTKLQARALWLCRALSSSFSSVLARRKLFLLKMSNSHYFCVFVACS